MQVERNKIKIYFVANGWVIYENLPRRLALEIPDIQKIDFASRWARTRLGSWWGNGLPSRRSLAGLKGWSATLELRQGPNFFRWGSSVESWTMSASLIQQYFMSEQTVVKL